MLKSFQDCEDQYFKKSLPEGLIPPWIVPLSNLNVATSIWHHNDNKSKFMGDLWRTFGNLYLFYQHPEPSVKYNQCSDHLIIGQDSDCPLPCKSTQVRVMKTADMATEDQQNVAYITFSKKIKREVITVDSFMLQESLNYLGSNLGLWPGLGLYQLLEGGFGIIIALKLFEKAKLFVFAK